MALVVAKQSPGARALGLCGFLKAMRGWYIFNCSRVVHFGCPPRYTSAEFQAVGRALLACRDADRAYLRRWVLRWIDDEGHILPDAEVLTTLGCESEGLLPPRERR